MKFSFDRQCGLIIVRARLTGPSGDTIGRLALDTGATTTLVNVAVLTCIGYDPAMETERFQVTTGSGIEFVPRVALEKLEALGQIEEAFSVYSHTLPASTGVDGILGLDFFRDRNLNIDFRVGSITVT